MLNDKNDSTSAGTTRVLVVLEGTNDIQFMRRIAAILRRDDCSLPDLASMEQRGELVFIPFGGGQVSAWARRLAPLGIPELHLFDREVPPETEMRYKVARIVNSRRHCRAIVMTKRSLENFLHPQAIRVGCGVNVQFDDDDSVPDVFAKSEFEQSCGDIAWDQLPRRAQRRHCNRAKRLLNAVAVNHMTTELLASRDPNGELVSWLMMIAKMAGSNS